MDYLIEPLDFSKEISRIVDSDINRLTDCNNDGSGKCCDGGNVSMDTMLPDADKLLKS